MHAARYARYRFRTALFGAALLCTTALAQDARPGVEADGSVRVAAATIPYSAYASPQARAFFPKMLAEGSKAPPLDGPIAQSRAF